jgi:hypothetical protein
VQQPIAQRLRLGLRQITVQELLPSPGDQIDRQHYQGQPGAVDRERSAGKVVQAGVLRAADAVLDPGVRPVPRVEVGELPAAGVGGGRSVAPPVTLFERVELRAGGRSRRTMIRIPAGWPASARVGRTWVISAIAASSRRPPSASTASAHTSFGMAPIAACSLSLIAHPAEKLLLTAPSWSARI